MKNKMPLIVVLAVLALLAGGCSTVKGPVRGYSGPERPDQAVARVSVPTDLEVRSIDGKEVKLPYAAGETYQVRLLPGRHRLRLVYKHLWGNASGVMVTSRPMDLEFDARAGAVYRVGFPEPRSEDDASVYAAAPKAWLIDSASGARVESSEVQGVGILRGVLSAVPVGAPPSSPAPSTHAGAVGADAEQQVMNADPAARLRFWWKLASPEQRRQFLDWTRRQ